MVGTRNESHLQVLTPLTCPHCWRTFVPEDILWIATHPDLQSDPRVGDDAGLRFLPTRFDVEGNAIDPRGMVCQELACPHCHLRVPRALLETSPLFVSIAGTPSCGKTYFLASMTWRLRTILPKTFAMSFADTDPVSNLVLNEYENEQFFNSNPDELVKLAKTQEHGHLYSTVTYGEQPVEYPRPFFFSIRPQDTHPNHMQAHQLSRVLCLYDNAGESFEPGRDETNSPVTRHLARAQVLMFCFDPTQDPRLRDACRAQSADLQFGSAIETRRQESVFHEMVARVRKHARLGQNEKYMRPLIVIVTKYDVWWPLIGQARLAPPWVNLDGRHYCALDVPRISDVSAEVRNVLWQYAPELVGAAEAFAHRVIYVPVSATGCGPEIDSNTGTTLGIRPQNINPMWTEVPLLVTLARWGGGMIPYMKRKTGPDQRTDARTPSQDTDIRFPQTR